MDTSISLYRFYRRQRRGPRIRGPLGRRTGSFRFWQARNIPEIDTLCKELGQRSSTRLTVVLPDGKVVGDSDESPQQMDNHASAPEVIAALQEDKGVGVSLRLSQTLQQNRALRGCPSPQPR